MSRRRKQGRPVHGILLLDKATGCSSNHALQQIKRLFDARKAGHTGSLDPLATGMLPICFGEATKLSQYLLEADKSYITGARLGSTTTTADAEGDVLEQRIVPADLTAQQIQEIANRFVGAIDQVPPMYSALKVDGQRLYRLAREGKTVERKARRVTIHSIQVLHLEDGLVAMEVHCSKGTYIRTLVEDIGEALGCGAHVESLRRTTVSPFTHQTMHSFTALEAQPSSSLDDLLLPPDAMLTHLPRCELPIAMAGLFTHGQPVPAVVGTHQDQSMEMASSAPLLVRVYGPEGLLGIGEQQGERLKPQRILNLRPSD